MAETIDYARSDDDIAATFEVMRQLRPALEAESYVATLRSLMHSDGLKLLALRDEGEVRAVASVRVMTMLYCGRLASIDDLVVDSRVRSRGYGRRLLARVEADARASGCSELQLISRVTREEAHRFYFREGFGIECFHFRKRLALAVD